MFLAWRNLRSLADQALSANTEAEIEFRRHALLAVLAIATVTSLITLALAIALDFQNSDKIGLAIVTAKNLGFFLLLRQRPQLLMPLGALHFAILAVTTVVKFSDAVLDEQVTYGLGAYSYWLPMVYVTAFLVFRGRTALIAALVPFTAVLAVGVAFWASSSIPVGTKTAYAYLFVQVYLTHAAFITTFVFLAILLDRYMRAIRTAENEAKFAYADDLTGLANRRQLTHWLKSHLARAASRNEALSVILFDLDHFKRVNDTLGHDTGDAVLQATAHSLMTALRRTTLFGRWGGEEFLVILPATTAEQAEVIAQRIRMAVASVEHAGLGRITASCGVAELLPGETLASLLRRADQASYQAKYDGRDCVRIAA
ncbi:GGDEF domain-containing protein [Deinococcus peraridilitoris]|uniref:Diguanylate cyclase (GGDEF) domain-containing protein n=1 Tax=Deinococcus peraridilitoris (strain DSM 19664 / LMG 22246 / CIP 109416 / KR-200) TaxID=937777 RepID=L0A5H1_DEIPD|nr:GGDEF domain-containing protein [Deinococcus peraridilitoris]AFZ68270.1 diguanylate cyclase (GGDEF) domain-containing protein [Deinococcus peraridilitoris DSM 19664]